MSKRTQLFIALTGLFITSALLAVLFAVILSNNSYSSNALPIAPIQARMEPPRVNQPPDPHAGRENDALRRVWRRLAYNPNPANAVERTIRQEVETDVFSKTFPGLFDARIERQGWNAFRLEDSVYEVQFNFRDVSVEFGPAWIVQTDPDGLQPPGSSGVVPANIFAEVLQSGVSEVLARYLNKEAEVIEVMTNHRFAQGARLGSALLVYFAQRQHAVPDAGLIGWTVIPERITPGQHTFYRAFFQWVERGRPRFAQWEINLETHEFRGLNLLASDIMATGDLIDTYQLQVIKPQNLEQAERDNPRHARLFQAARRIVDDDRLVEAIAALLWDQSRVGVEVQYPDPPTRWDLAAVASENRIYEVSYPFTVNGEQDRVTYRVDLSTGLVQPQSELASRIHMTLHHVRRPLAEIDVLLPRPDERAQQPATPVEQPVAPETSPTAVGTVEDATLGSDGGAEGTGTVPAPPVSPQPASGEASGSEPTGDPSSNE